MRVLEGADGPGAIGREDPEGLAGLVREHRAHVAGVEHPLAVRTDRHRMQRVVVVDALEPGQQHLTFVHRRIEAQITIDVGIDNEVGRLRDDDLVVDDRDAQRSDEPRLLHERVRGLGLAIAVLVLHDDDAIALGLPGVMRAVANPLGDPDAPVSIDVDVGRVAQQRRRGPQRHFEPVRDLEEAERNLRGLGSGRLRGRWSGLLHRQRADSLWRRDGHQHQHEHQVQRREGKSTHKSPKSIRSPARPTSATA